MGVDQYLRIFRWHVLRHIRHHRLLAVLNILSVALGVAVYLATQIANQSANRAFAATIDMVSGKADLEITAPDGNLLTTCAPRSRSRVFRRCCCCCRGDSECCARHS